MRVVSFGNQIWGHRTLQALLDSRHEVILAVTHPHSEHDYTSIWADSVGDLAHANGIPVHSTLRADADTVALVERAEPDVIVVNSWYTRMPAALYEIPPYGTLNFHDSLLPRFAGFSPMLWALIAGEHEVGLTIHRMNDELDGGDILVQHRIPVRDTDTGTSLVHAGLKLIGPALDEALSALESGSARWMPQDRTQRTFFHKRDEYDSRIDWRLSAQDLERFVRALSDPYPNAYSYWRGNRIRIVTASVSENRYGGRPGRVFVRDGDGMAVVCGPDAFRGGNHGLVVRRVRTDDGTEHDATALLWSGGRFIDTQEIAL